MYFIYTQIRKFQLQQQEHWTQPVKKQLKLNKIKQENIESKVKKTNDKHNKSKSKYKVQYLKNIM